MAPENVTLLWCHLPRPHSDLNALSSLYLLDTPISSLFQVIAGCLCLEIMDRLFHLLQLVFGAKYRKAAGTTAVGVGEGGSELSVHAANQALVLLEPNLDVLFSSFA